MKIFLIVLCIFSFGARAEPPTPIEALEHFIDLFNDQNTQALNDSTNVPWFTILDGKTTSFQSYSEMIDFEGLKKTGWSYSKARDIEVLLNDGSTAIVEGILERFDSNDRLIFRGELIFLLVRKEAKWNMAGWISSGNGQLPLGK